MCSIRSTCCGADKSLKIMEEAEGAAVVESEADKLRDRHRTEVKELRSEYRY